jgi:poly(3-hydroxybutyrate) depolymerase
MLCLGSACATVANETPLPIRIERSPSGLRFGVMGEWRDQPAPLILMLQGSLETAQREPIYTEAARLLVRQGFIAVMMDAPAHGEHAQTGEGAELEAWNARVGAGDALLVDFIRQAQHLLDWMIEQGYVDPRRIAVAGTSRGGFLAFHLAAADTRFGWVGGISPVTDLCLLREFAACPRPAAAAALAVEHLVPRLAGRPVWISIGNNDTRVGTDAAVRFARRLAAAGATEGGDAPVELLVHSTPGHRSTSRDHERLAAWLLEQLPPAGR